MVHICNISLRYFYVCHSIKIFYPVAYVLANASYDVITFSYIYYFFIFYQKIDAVSPDNRLRCFNYRVMRKQDMWIFYFF